MISLFLDTAQEKLIVAIARENELIFYEELLTKNNHSEYFVPIIEKALKANKLKPTSIDKIFVVNGPGSFTGTRIAVTVAKTFAYSINKNLIPVSSLKEYIFFYDNYDYYVSILEDKKEKIYYGIYDKNYDDVISDCYSDIQNLKNDIEKLNGSILVVSDKEYGLGYKTVPKKININRLINYYCDKEFNSFIVKPNYLKKIEAESKL